MSIRRTLGTLVAVLTLTAVCLLLVLAFSREGEHKHPDATALRTSADSGNAVGPAALRGPAGSQGEEWRAAVEPTARDVRPDDARTLWLDVVASSGQPARGAVVRALPHSSLRRSRRVLRLPYVCTETDDAGKAILQVPEDWGDGSPDVVAEDARLCEVTTSPRPCEIGGHARLQLRRAQRIEGRVLGIIAGKESEAKVRAFSPSWPDAPCSRVIDVSSDGTFSLLTSPSWVRLYAVSPGRVPSGSWTGSVRQGDSPNVTLILGPLGEQGSLWIRVGQNGLNLPEGSLVYAGSSGGMLQPTPVDAGGWITLNGLGGADEVAVLVYPTQASDGSWLNERALLRVPMADVVRGTSVEIPQAADAVFRFSDPEGGALPLMSVALDKWDPSSAGWKQRAEGVTSELGRWSPMRDKPMNSGRFRVRCSWGYAVWEGDLHPGSGLVSVQCPDARWTEVVLQDWTGRDVATPNVSVAVRDSTAPGTSSSRSTLFRDFKHAHSVRMYYPGSWRHPVLVERENWLGRTMVELGPGSVGGTIRIGLSRNGGCVRLHLEDAEGLPLRTAFVLQHPDREERYAGTTGGDGNAILYCVAPGTYRIYVTFAGTTLRAERSVEVLEGEWVEVASAVLTQASAPK